MATTRTRARPGDPMRWPVDRDYLTGQCVLHQPDGTLLIYLADRRPTWRERAAIRRRFGKDAIVMRSSLAETLIEVLGEFVEGRPNAEMNLARLRRLAGETRWDEFLAVQQAVMDNPALLVRETG